MSRGSGWRLRVSHESRFDYDGHARSSYNELRLTPRTEQRQTALEARVVTRSRRTPVHLRRLLGHARGGLQRRPGAHDMLSIIGLSLVDTQRAEEPEDCSWE